MVIASGYHEQAGGLLLLAAATETGLLTQLEQALPPPPVPRPRLAFPWQAVQQSADACCSPCCFWERLGLPRTWDLRGYTADGLALLTGRTRAYGYRYTEVFLSQVARADGAERFTDALASWTTHLWHTPAEGTREGRSRTPTCADLLCGWTSQTCLQRRAHPTWTDWTFGRRPGLPSTPVAARRARPSPVRDHPSRRPASHRGRSRIPGAL